MGNIVIYIALNQYNFKVLITEPPYLYIQHYASLANNYKSVHQLYCSPALLIIPLFFVLFNDTTASVTAFGTCFAKEEVWLHHALYLFHLLG